MRNLHFGDIGILYFLLKKHIPNLNICTVLHQKAPHVYLIWQLASIWGAQLHFHIAVQSVWKKSKTLICIYRGSYITRQKLLHLVLIPSKKTLSIDDFFFFKLFLIFLHVIQPSTILWSESCLKKSARDLKIEEKSEKYSPS